jgi:hypothetical protein
MSKIYICERCAAKYKLDDAYFFRKNSKGIKNKIYSALSYQYCGECLPYFEKDAEKRIDN